MLPQHSCCAGILPALAKKCLYTALVMLLAPMASGWTAGRAVRTWRIPLRKALQVQPGQRWSFLEIGRASCRERGYRSGVDGDRQNTMCGGHDRGQRESE